MCVLSEGCSYCKQELTFLKDEATLLPVILLQEVFCFVCLNQGWLRPNKSLSSMNSKLHDKSTESLLGFYFIFHILRLQ